MAHSLARPVKSCKSIVGEADSPFWGKAEEPSRRHASFVTQSQFFTHVASLWHNRRPADGRRPKRCSVMCDIPYAIISQVDGKRIILSPAEETWIDLDADRIGIGLELGLLTFLRHGKWGLVDTAGQVVVEPQFDELGSFMESLRGIAWAKRNDRWCAIDRRGRTLTSIACTETDPMPGPRGTLPCKVEP